MKQSISHARNELHSSSPWNLRIKELLPKLLAVSGRILQDTPAANCL